jgi:hypothetical protein
MDLGVGTRRSPGVAVFTAVTTGNDRMAGGGGDQQTEEEDEVAGIAEHLAHRHAGVFLLHRCVGAQVHALGARDGPDDQCRGGARERYAACGRCRRLG